MRIRGVENVESRGWKPWTTYWEPVRGCKKVSEGCLHCYAERVCRKMCRWTYKDFCQPRKVDNPQKPPKKGVVNVCGLSDLFGEWNTNGEIVYWLNQLDADTKNLVLTKRAERMAKMNPVLPEADNYYYGVSCETQERFDERAKFLPWLGRHRKFVCLEPLLGPIVIPPDIILDWIVVGVEGGYGKRHAEAEWLEAIGQYAQEREIPLFVRSMDIGGKVVRDINKFPEVLQKRQYPWNHGH